MDSLKDSLRDHKKTVTMSSAQVNFLTRINQRTQVMLDHLQEMQAAEFLHFLAVSEFGMDPNKDFNFEYHPELESDNLIITEKINKK